MQIGQHCPCKRLCVGLFEESRKSAHRQCSRRDDRKIETECSERAIVFVYCTNFDRIGSKSDWNRQRLRGQGGLGERPLEFLIKDAFVCGMHIYQYYTFSILRYDIDALQLTQRCAQKMLACWWWILFLRSC